MAQFTGRLNGPNLEPSTVLIDIADERFRVSTGRMQLGSWKMVSIRAERTSIYRFDLDIDGDSFEFIPEDPSGFSDALGAVVDLTESKGLFGLKARIEKAAGS